MEVVPVKKQRLFGTGSVGYSRVSKNVVSSSSSQSQGESEFLRHQLDSLSAQLEDERVLRTQRELEIQEQLGNSKREMEASRAAMEASRAEMEASRVAMEASLEEHVAQATTAMMRQFEDRFGRQPPPLDVGREQNKTAFAVRQWLSDGLPTDNPSLNYRMIASKEFNIEDNPPLKKEVLKKCNSRWRKFKSKLKEKYIDKQPENPAYVTYKAFISKDDLNEFVKLRTSTKAVSASQKAKECRQKNVHNHRMGQQAYAQKEEIWKSEGRYSNTSSSGTAMADADVRKQKANDGEF
ncbi:hypothetical protein OROMI_000942 [Orobanche minor]